MLTEKRDLDEWKTFVLLEIIKKDEDTFTDNIWHSIKIFTLDDGDMQKSHYCYKECVLKA